MIFKPKIIAFVCNWSLPPEVEVTTPSLIRGYPKVRIVRVMCAGRLDPAIVLETFLRGADGVLVVRCVSPDCHYVDGNMQAERKVRMLKGRMALTGFDPERLRWECASASEIETFARSINAVRNQVPSLGSSPLVGEEADSRLLLNVNAAKAVAENFTLRVLTGREKGLTGDANVYGERLSQEEFDRLMVKTIGAEFIRHKIRLLTAEKPMSVKQIAVTTSMEPSLALCHVVNMRRKGMIALGHVEGTSPLYRALEVR